MSIVKNSRMEDQYEIIGLLVIIAFIISPALVLFILAERSSPVEKMTYVLSRSHSYLLIAAFVILGLFVQRFIKNNFSKDFDRYRRIVDVVFNKDLAVIRMNDGEVFSVEYDDIFDVNHESSREMEELEYAQNCLVIKLEDDVLVFPYTSKEIYLKFLDIIVPEPGEE